MHSDRKRKTKTTEQTTMDNGELTSMLHKASWNVIRLVKDNKIRIIESPLSGPW